MSVIFTVEFVKFIILY